MMRADDEIPGWLHAAIHEAAGRHEPDRAHMYARVRAATPLWGWRRRLRIAGTALATTAAVAVATTVGWQGFAGRGPTPAEPLAGGSSPSLRPPGGSATPSGAASPMATHPSPVPLGRRTASVVPPRPGTGRFLTCTGRLGAGSNAFVTHEKLTVTTGRPLGALRVTFRIAGTRGVVSAGSSLSLPPDDFVVSIRKRDGVLSYQFVLKRGRTVPAGGSTFTVQYHHPEGGHDGDLDTYVVNATATSGAEARVRGHF